MKIDYETIGMKVRFYRLQAKMSQETLAEHADVSRVFISSVERGEKPPSLETIISIANALQVSLDELLSETLVANKSERNQSNVFIDCTPEEYRFLLETVSCLKEILKRYSITQ